MASLLFRASPIDPALRPPSPSNSQSNDLAYNPSSSSVESQSATDTAQGVSSASSQYSTTLPDLASSSLEKSSQEGTNSANAFSSSLGPSLPGLSVLASVASAPTSNLRCVHDSWSNPHRHKRWSRYEYMQCPVPCPWEAIHASQFLSLPVINLDSKSQLTRPAG